MLLSDTLTPAGHGQLGKIISPLSLSPSSSSRPLRYAVLGAGFAGLSVTWHLLKVKYSAVLYFVFLFSRFLLLYFWGKKSMFISAEESKREGNENRHI